MAMKGRVNRPSGGFRLFRRKRKPKPPQPETQRRRVFPSTEFSIGERSKFEQGWRLLERVRAATPEERLRTALQEWGKREDVSRVDARRLLRLWGVPEQVIERVVSTYPYPE